MSTYKTRLTLNHTRKRRYVSLEPEFWAELEKFAGRLNMSVRDFIDQAMDKYPRYRATDAARVHLLMLLAKDSDYLRTHFDVGIGPGTPTLEKMF